MSPVPMTIGIDDNAVGPSMEAVQHGSQRRDVSSGRLMVARRLRVHRLGVAISACFEL